MQAVWGWALAEIVVNGYRNRGIVLVDDADAERFAGMRVTIIWDRRRKIPYAYARVRVGSDARTRAPRYAFLHGMILSAPDGMDIDHANGNGLDNRRSNLRFATRSQNSANSNKKGSTSRFRGVCWDKRRGNWHVAMRCNYRSVNIGNFASEEAAARAYDAKALELFGEFARLNFPEDAALASRHEAQEAARPQAPSARPGRLHRLRGPRPPPAPWPPPHGAQILPFRLRRGRLLRRQCGVGGGRAGGDVAVVAWEG